MKPTILEKYPVLTPYVGKNYNHDHHKRILIIGESHYLPENESNKSELNKWYSSSLKTNPISDESYINTAGVVSDSINNKKLQKGHTFFNNLSISINQAYQNSYEYQRNILHHIAFLNFFPRPATYGKSLNVHSLDTENGKAVLNWFILKEKPEVVIVVSSKAGYEAINVLRNHKLDSLVTAHPASAWWNREAKKYGGKTSKLAFEEFLKEKEVFKII